MINLCFCIYLRILEVVSRRLTGITNEVGTTNSSGCT
jgi:hypothetical protein